MENVQETPIEQPETAVPRCMTPPPDRKLDAGAQNSGRDLRKYGSPDPLQVPKALKYPERYRSPTDTMVSPVTRGLLARNRKGGALLPPSLTQPKVQEVQVQEGVSFKIEI